MNPLATCPLPVSWSIGFAAGLGLLVGSFCNVMGLRLLSETDFVGERSECPLCHTKIAWYDNLPVISYLVLGAKCRHCASPISLQYPLVELATAGLFAAVVATFGLTWGTPFLLLFVANAMVMVITDWREKLIFHINSWGAVPIGLVYNLLGIDGGLTSATAWSSVALWSGGPAVSGAFLSALTGVVVLFVLFEGMIWLSRLVFGTDGFGHGDTYLLMGVAAFLGWELTLLSLVLGFAIQTVVALPLLIWQWIRHRQWKLMGTLGGSLLTGFVPLGLMQGDTLAGTGGLVLILVMMGITLVLLYQFMQEVKRQEHYTYLPLGPALIAGALLALFFGKGWLATLTG